MVNVVLDTNVLLASLLQPKGPNRQVLRTILSHPRQFTICFSSQMWAEYEDVLSRPVVSVRGIAREASALLDVLRDVGEEVVPKPVYAVVYPDRDDRPFLEAAVYVDGVLITNNLKDFPFVGVVVLGPEDFLGWCDTQGL